VRTLLIVASGAFTVAAAVPYTVATARGHARPQAVSWGVWAALMAIGAVAALSNGQVPAAVYGLCCAAECALIAVLALRGPRSGRDPPATVKLPRGRTARLDFICLGGAVAGLVLLAVARAPGPAVTASVLTDLVACIPTIAHAWRDPDEENWPAYALYAAGAGLALAAADLHVFTAVAYPLYLLAADTGIAALIPARRAYLAGRARGGTAAVAAWSPRTRSDRPSALPGRSGVAAPFAALI
jgi:hypothetical protein